MTTEIVFIGGRSGVGKSTVGWEIHRLLATAEVMHALVEGDTLDQAWPEPWPEHPLAERNLAAIWRNYTELGYRRMVYTNTAAVFPSAQRTLVEAVEALGAPVRAVSVLLTATDRTVAERLSLRESGESLAWHLERSRTAARELDAGVPSSVARISTDGRAAVAIAADVVALTGWLDVAVTRAKQGRNYPGMPAP